MDTKTLIDEIKTFLKESKKTILLSTIIIFFIAVALQVVAYFINSTEETEMNSNLVHTHAFDIYIEQNNLGAYTNSYLLETFLKREDIINIIEEESNVVIAPVLEEYRRNNDIVTTTETDPINIERDTSTNILTVSFGVSTDEENERIAETYYEWLSTTDFPFFDDKQLYFMSEPHTIIEEQSVIQNESFSMKSSLVRLVLALFGGLVLGLIISLIKALYSEKLMYGFTYSWDEKDTFLYFNKSTQSKEISHSIIHPSHGIKVILSENQLNSSFVSGLEQLKDNKSTLIFSSAISNLDPALEINEFVLIVERKRTNKQWYQDQRKQLKGYHSPVIKIVQI